LSALTKSLLSAVHLKYAYLPRLEALSEAVGAWLRAGDEVLDVGCGSGMLAEALRNRAPGVVVSGLEKHPRGGEPIEVHSYTGTRFPFPDDAFDVITIADVLHHDQDPVGMLREYRRVARRAVVVKDHLVEGRIDYVRVCILDWAANLPHGVRCLYDYWSLEEWHDMFDEEGLSVSELCPSMNLYHPVPNLIFGGRIHFLALTFV